MTVMNQEKSTLIYKQLPLRHVMNRKHTVIPAIASYVRSTGEINRSGNEHICGLYDIHWMDYPCIFL